MKKTIFLVIAAFAGSVSFAQQKQSKPPPPPPKVNVDKFVPPPTPPKQPSKVKNVNAVSYKKPGYQEFLKGNPIVKRLTWPHENTVRFYLKSGKQETYDLKKENDVQTVKNKYGELPIAPPRPPKPKVEKFAPPVIEAE